MSLEFAIDHPCVLRARYSEQHLREWGRLGNLHTILTTGDQPKVFNGVCGAESGQVPVAAVAPSMLFSEMEVQKRGHEHERPPLLPPPGFEDASAAKDGQMKAEVKP